MERNTVLLRETEAFMRGELDNVTVSQNSIVLDLVQGSYVPLRLLHQCADFDAGVRCAAGQLERGFAQGHGCGGPGSRTGGRQLDALGGLWQMEPYLHRESPAYQERGPVQRWPAHLQLDSKYATQAQLRIYLYSKG